MSDVLETVLPSDKTLNVDVQLIPNLQDRVIVLLVPLGDTKVKMNTFTHTNKGHFTLRKM